MKILGIETSCDETAAAVVEGTIPDRPVRVLSQAMASSQRLHRKSGGIVPEVAARRQIESIIPVIQECIDSAQRIEGIDAIAVTVGPGLVGSLLVGVETAKALSFVWEKPIIPVNHLVAHLYANWIRVGNNEKEVMSKGRVRDGNSVPSFPAIGLVASGGHTDLVLMKGHGNLKYLGRTRDDATGEAFDKIARLLGLGYPGGPAIAAAAEKSEIRNSPKSSATGQVKSEIHLPRPMIDSEDYDFSFSGLKTAVLRMVGNVENVEYLVEEIASEVQEAVVDVLVAKVMQAIQEFRPRSLLLGGGVVANRRLSQQLETRLADAKGGIELYIPPPVLCTDNAVMVAATAFYNPSPVPWRRVRVDPGLSIVP